jgi:phage terminase large subunit-like protein
VFELKRDPVSGTWRRRRRRVLLGMPSGSGKTELLAAIGLYMLCGRVHVSPSIPVAAASKEQANLLFGAARIMCEESRTLRKVTETGVDAITLKGEPGRMYRVAAADGTNEGQRPSTFLADELHEWAETKNTFAVISKGAAKRTDSLQLYITTAGFDLDTICGRLYLHGQRVLAGELVDDDFLMLWFEAPADADPADPDTWRTCHPAAGDFVTIEALGEQYRSLPINLFRRYFLNQWTEAASSWLPHGAWAACRMEEVPTSTPWPAAGMPASTTREQLAAELRARLQAIGFDPSLPVHVGWDASTKYDSTAIVAVQRRLFTADDGELIERVLVLSRTWERPNDRDGRPREDWIIPIDDVTAYLWALAGATNVSAIQFDPAFVSWEADKLRQAGLPMREFPQHTARMGVASQALYELVLERVLGHDGDPVLARHIASAVAKQQRTGSAAWRLVKGDAKRKMDATIALAMAVWSMGHPDPEAERKAKKPPNTYGLDDDELEEALGNP